MERKNPSLTPSVNATLAQDTWTGNEQPIRVGILSSNKNEFPQTSPTNLMAYMARNFNIELYLFTPKDIDFEKKTVKALLVEGKKRTPKTIPLPKIVDSVPEIFLKERGRELQRRLEKICHCVRPKQNLSKGRIYDILSADARFKKLLIETHDLKDFNHFLSLLEQYQNDVVVKLSSGTEGRDVFRITFENDKYTICPGNEEPFSLAVKDFINFYNEHFSSSRQVLQPYITSRTKYGNPFDIRIHARRGADGNFKLFPYPRLGSPGGILSNISAGGYSIPIKTFLMNEFGNDWQMLYDKIIKIGNTLPDYLQSFFKKTVLAMGIDVGIQRRGDSYELKIFEVNHNNPGTKAIKVEAVFSLLEYLQYLGRQLAEKENMSTAQLSSNAVESKKS